MKKLFILFSVFTLTFSSCSSDDDGGSQDPFVGTWKYSQAFEDGVEITLEDCEDETTVVISSNGTYQTTVYEDDLNGGCEIEYTNSGSWENLGQGMYSTTSEGDTFVMEVTFEGNTFSTTETDDGVTYVDVYTRQ